MNFQKDTAKVKEWSIIYIFTQGTFLELVLLHIFINDGKEWEINVVKKFPADTKFVIILKTKSA